MFCNEELISESDSSKLNNYEKDIALLKKTIVKDENLKESTYNLATLKDALESVKITIKLFCRFIYKCFR